MALHKHEKEGKSLDFSHIVFLGNSLFFGDSFDGDANFSWATFKGNADFTGATFEGDADFMGTEFKGDTKSKADAKFNEGAKFSGLTVFYKAEFDKRVFFSGAIFNGYAHFDAAKFSGETHFPHTRFGQGATFQGSVSWAERSSIVRQEKVMNFLEYSPVPMLTSDTSISIRTMLSSCNMQICRDVVSGARTCAKPRLPVRNGQEETARFL